CSWVLLLLFFSAAAVSRAQVQQELSAETSEGTGINITCSHPNIKTGDYIHWYRQLPGRGPAFLVSAVRGSKEVPDPQGRLSVSSDHRSSALWLARPRRGDAAVYYCAVAHGERCRGCGRARTALGGTGAQCRPGPKGALPAWPPNSILTRVGEVFWDALHEVTMRNANNKNHKTMTPVSWATLLGFISLPHPITLWRNC
uniref:Ig-like domain-containing protein n=1 Tax=Phasianus colchicus TaxID=9054 RepID=A0A669QHD0_PHACC